MCVFKGLSGGGDHLEPSSDKGASWLNRTGVWYGKVEIRPILPEVQLVGPHSSPRLVSVHVDETHSDMDGIR